MPLTRFETQSPPLPPLEARGGSRRRRRSCLFRRRSVFFHHFLSWGDGRGAFHGISQAEGGRWEEEEEEEETPLPFPPPLFPASPNALIRSHTDDAAGGRTRHLLRTFGVPLRIIESGKKSSLERSKRALLLLPVIKSNYSKEERLHFLLLDSA